MLSQQIEGRVLNLVDRTLQGQGSRTSGSSARPDWPPAARACHGRWRCARCGPGWSRGACCNAAGGHGRQHRRPRSCNGCLTLWPQAGRYSSTCRHNQQTTAKRMASQGFDFGAWLRASTQAQGVPEKVADEDTLRAVARMVKRARQSGRARAESNTACHPGPSTCAHPADRAG